MSRPLKHRDIACARCFRLKRKCDHAKPTCGECLRKGAECLPARSRRVGDSVTVPVAYLKDLERRVAELEGHARDSETHTELCDVGVQTDSIEDEEPLATAQCIPATNTDLISDESALMLLSTPQLNQKIYRSSTILQSPFTEPFFRGWDDTLDFLHLDRSPSRSLRSDIGSDPQLLLELYATLYFSITHREWPFLDETTWRTWQSEEDPCGDDWRTFFLRIVHAIGASLCCNMHGDQAHADRSRELYISAMRYHPYVVAHSSMVLQVQASLLLIVYAMHSPSSEEIAATVSSIVPFCTAAMTEIRKYARVNIDGEIIARSGETLTENMFIASFMLNVIIVSGWDRPVSAEYLTVDDDVSDDQSHSRRNTDML